MRARRTRVIAAGRDAIWEVVGDAHHFPRWWPGVIRVEGVGEDRFTHVYSTKKGRMVRIDFRLVASEPPGDQPEMPARRVWEQEIPGTPFERVLRESVTEVVLQLAEADGEQGTKVTIEQTQNLRGYSKTGGWMLKRATKQRLDRALEGLEQIFGGDAAEA
jgi:carbon monoxide dehydrogenase subunit G